MIINIRGTSGSGKTTVMRGLMDRCIAKVAQENPTAETRKLKMEGYQLLLPVKPGQAAADRVYVLGSYENVCGGCDAIPTQDEICRRVRMWAPAGHVLMEGLLMSHLFSRYATLNRELRPTPYVWAFLDTPLGVCLDRVKARRAARGVDEAVKPFNPHNTEQKWHDMRRVFKKCQTAGLDARWIPYETATDEIWKILTC